MKTLGHWVIKTSAGGYWCSGGFDPQIRKAHIYVWKEKAEEQIAWMIRKKFLPSDITYEVVAVSEPKELKDTEAEWFTVNHSIPVYACSSCHAPALCDPRGISVDSKFCPHCGKFMINYTPEDDE